MQDVILRCTLRDRRLERGWSLKQLAAMADVNHGTISKYERDVEQMSIKVAAQFALLLNCSLDDLYTYRPVAGEA